MDAGSSSWLLLLRVGAAIGVGAGLLLTVRWISRVCPTAGLIVAAGIVLKAVIAGLLFWISFLELPLLESHHIGGGFWYLADDARQYYRDAASAAALGLNTIDWREPAPGYVRSLAVAIMLFGDSPAAAILLNLTAYAATCALLTALLLAPRTHSAQRAGLVTLIAVTFSPLLFLSSTQPLKEELFCTGIVLAMTGAVVLLPELVHARAGGSRRRLVVGLGALWLGTYVIGGIRPYYPLYVWAAVAATLGMCLGTQRLRRLPAFAVSAIAILALLWSAFVLGSGPEYYGYYSGKAWAVVTGTSDASPGSSGVPVSPARVAGSLMSELDNDRNEFINRAGGTNWVSSTSAETGIVDEVKSTATGLLLLVLPASLLNSLSAVDFSGGRGLLLVTDIDTLFQDAMFVAVIAVLLKRREAVKANLPFVIFTSLLVASVALSLAYVVVNYGTLFRLRLLVALPLWMLALAASDGPSVPSLAIVQPQEPDTARSGRLRNWMMRTTSTVGLSIPLASLGEGR